MRAARLALLVLLFSSPAAGPLAQAPPENVSSPLDSLVETERAFARTSVEKGRRAAFLAFFADDAIFFAPEPANARARVQTWPERNPFALDWEPYFGDVAIAGDLGYTTGPFVRTSPEGDGKILGTGWFFTVWKKQPDGTWKVAVDAGINSAAGGPLRPASFRQAISDDRPPRATAASLVAVDRAFCNSIATAGWERTLLAEATEDTRVYREGLPPVVGADAIHSRFSSFSGRLTCEPIAEQLSASSDLGYTYGRYSVSGDRQESGYYLRVWKRRAAGWKVAVDLQVAGR